MFALAGTSWLTVDGEDVAGVLASFSCPVPPKLASAVEVAVLEVGKLATLTNESEVKGKAIYISETAMDDLVKERQEQNSETAVDDLVKERQEQNPGLELFRSKYFWSEQIRSASALGAVAVLFPTAAALKVGASVTMVECKVAGEAK